MHARKSFTLVELLVVIAIISILAGMLLPALQRARQQALQTNCANNHKQVVTAMILYTESYEGRTTPLNLATGWSGTNPTRLKNWWNNLLVRDRLLPNPTVWHSENEGHPGEGVLTCPARTQPLGLLGIYASGSYSVDYNKSLKLTGIKRPSRRIIIGDSQDVSPSASITTPSSSGGSDWDTNTAARPMSKIHNLGALGAFFDGHVEHRKYVIWNASPEYCFRDSL